MNSFALGLVASAVAVGTALTPALAQTTAPGSTTTAPGSTMAAPGSTPPAAAGAPMGTMSGPATRTGTMPAAGTPGSMAAPGTAPGGQAAASGNDNQAVATTAANASTPARGSNSFTMGEARRRIAARGYTHVANLKKDSGGVWRGTAQKDGASTGVWLDYKGNIGQQAS